MIKRLGSIVTHPKHSDVIVVSGGLILLAAIAYIALLGEEFVYGQDHLQRPVVAYVSVYLLAWLGFGLAFVSATRSRSRSILVFVLSIAALLRLILLFSNPILENDFYRYTWDGNVLKHGSNPFAQAPAELSVQTIELDPARWDAASLIHERINYPEIKTIYPWVAQLTFLINAELFGWAEYGMRYTLLAIDLLLIVLLMCLIKRRGLAPAVILVYAWNPLILKEVTNSMHVDIVCALFLAWFITCVFRRYYLRAWCALFLSTFVKITPVLLCPLLLWLMIRRREYRKAALYSCAFVVASATAVALMFLNADAPFSGLAEFSSTWETNGSIYPLVKAIFEASISSGAAGAGARWVAVATMAVALIIACRRIGTEDDLIRWSALILMISFLLAPVGNPWYLVWLTPFLVVSRHAPVLALMIVTSLYYCTFHLIYKESEDIAYNVLKVIEYSPFFLFWFWITLRGYRTARRRREMRDSPDVDNVSPASRYNPT